MKSCSSVRRRAFLASAALLPVQALGGMAWGQTAPPAMTVLSTTGMVADLAESVGHGMPGVSFATLLGHGVDPHLFRPTRADVARVLRAAAVFHNGLKLEDRMEEVLDQARRTGRIVHAVAEAVPAERLRADPEYPDTADPHLWMDPMLWAECAPGVADALRRLQAATPGQAPTDIAANIAALRLRYARLDAYAQEAIGSIPAEARVLVTAHDAFGYFNARYGLEEASIQGLSTDAEANLGRIEELVALLVARRVPAVFAESSVPDRAMRALIEGAAARGHEVRLGGVLFSDSVGPAGSYVGGYEGMMDHNITTIARALGGRAPERGLNGRL